MSRHRAPDNAGFNPRNDNTYQPRHSADTTPMDLPARSGVVFAPGAGQTPDRGGASAVRALIDRARGNR